MSFSDYELSSTLTESIAALGFQNPTPIQSAVLPTILEGKDISGLAQTGTGKTGAFLIPLIERVLRSKNDPQNPRAYPEWRARSFVLILVPTRELAEQVVSNVESLGKDSQIKSVSIYGGTGYEKQKEAMKEGVDFIVATPGRLIDLYKEHVVDLKMARAVVFDEADRLFDMGFKDDMKYILSRVPENRQLLMFSATLNFDVLNVAYQFGSEPVEVDISRAQTKSDNVKDEILHVGQEDKPRFLLSILKRHNPSQAILFCNYKHNVESLAQFLNDNGVKALAISSLLSQAQRTKVMAQFKSQTESHILVATDVAARGLDVEGVDLVINYDMPQDSETYVHRVGRTGRAGKQGIAFSLVSDLDIESLGRVESYLKSKLPIGWMDDADLVVDFKEYNNRQRRYQSSRPERSHGDRPPRHDNRGPRRGGGRPDNTGGGRKEARGERPERQFDRGGPERGGPDRHGPERGPRGPRPKNAQGGGRPQQRRNAEGAATSGNGHKPTGPRKGRSSGPHQNNPQRQNRGRGGPSPSPMVAQKSIGQKITGFIKKIFG